MADGYWVTRTYTAGAVREKCKYFVPGKRPSGRDRRAEKKAIRAQEKNDASAIKTLARLINANFGGGDYLMGLDYSPAGYDRLLAGIEGLEKMDEAQRQDAIWAAASHELELCVRRVKYRCKKMGIELKGIWITSDMDGSTGDAARVHHHMIVCADAMELFTDAWADRGSVDYRQMYANQQDRRCCPSTPPHDRVRRCNGAVYGCVGRPRQRGLPPDVRQSAGPDAHGRVSDPAGAPDPRRKKIQIHPQPDPPPAAGSVCPGSGRDPGTGWMHTDLPRGLRPGAGPVHTIPAAGGGSGPPPAAGSVCPGSGRDPGTGWMHTDLPRGLRPGAGPVHTIPAAGGGSGPGQKTARHREGITMP